MGKEERLGTTTGDLLPIDFYQRELKALKEFSIIDIEAVMLIGGLRKIPRITSKIKKNILKILLDEGRWEEIADKYYKTVRLLDKPLKDGAQRIGVFLLDNPETDQKDFYFAVYRQENNHGKFLLNDLSPIYDFTLPKGEGIFDPLHFQANDWERGKHYWPTYYSGDLTERKGFLQILQRGVRDFLSVLPERTKIPEVFHEALQPVKV